MLGLEHQLARSQSGAGDWCNPSTVSWEGLFLVITLPRSSESWFDWYEKFVFFPTSQQRLSSVAFWRVTFCVLGHEFKGGSNLEAITMRWKTEGASFAPLWKFTGHRTILYVLGLTLFLADATAPVPQPQLTSCRKCPPKGVFGKYLWLWRS